MTPEDLMDLARLLLGLLPALTPTAPWDTGIATTMLREHAGTGGRAACADHGLLRRLLPRDGRVRDDLALVATRNARRYPCGSTIEIVLPRQGTHTVAIVADRGPAGIRCPDGRRLATRDELRRDRLPAGCAWSADLDLTPAAHRALGGDGYEWVRFRPLHPRLARLLPTSRRSAP